MSISPPRKINILSVNQSPKISVWVCDKKSTWRPRKINIPTDSQLSKNSVWVCDKMSTWPPWKINILTVSQSSKISVWVCDKMSISPPRKINILICQSVAKDLCMSLWQKVDLAVREKSTSQLTVSCQRTLYESVTKCRPDRREKSNILTDSQSSKISVWVCDTMSTWPPRKINILTVSHSSKISVWICDKMSTWPPRKINIPNWQSVVKDLCMMSDLTKCRPDRREKTNILTDSQSPKISVWVCDKMSI